MIKYYKGTVFNVGTQAIVNTVNCVGVMGAGIALEFKLRYPSMFNDYKLKCDANKIVTGKVDYFTNQDDTIIINFPTKLHFKYPSKLEWIEQGLDDFAKTYRQSKVKSVAFPKLGTSKGGLDWNLVRKVMEEKLSNLDIEVYICLGEETEAEGVEKEMLDLFNNSSTNELSEIVKLNSKQKMHINKNVPYTRFWEIANTESIGVKTYSSIFDHYYKLAIGKKEISAQINLFNF